MTTTRKYTSEFSVSAAIFRAVNDDYFAVVEYRNISSVQKAAHEDDVLYIWECDKANCYTVRCNDRQERIDITRELLKRKTECLEHDAVQREEDRAERASLLAHLGKLTERIAFDPDVGDEALDAIERCKKRAREEE